MLKALVLVASILLVPIMSNAQALTLIWDRNAEADLVTHYQVYWCPGLTCADTALVLAPNPVVMNPVAPIIPSWPVPDGFVGRLAVTALNLAYTDSSVTPILNIYNESDKSISIGVNAKRGGKPTNPRAKR